VTLRPSDLPDETTILFMGDIAKSYGKIAHAAECPW
jgi:hypothetical protein